MAELHRRMGLIEGDIVSKKRNESWQGKAAKPGGKVILSHNSVEVPLSVESDALFAAVPEVGTAVSVKLGLRFEAQKGFGENSRATFALVVFPLKFDPLLPGQK